MPDAPHSTDLRTPGVSPRGLRTGVTSLGHHNPRHLRADLEAIRALGCDDVLLAESLHGEEAIDTGYRLRVSALSTDAGLSLNSLLGQPVLLELLAGPFQGVRPFHGHVTAAEMTGANGGLARYTLTIEPWTAFLALGRDSFLFTDDKSGVIYKVRPKR